jgi:hypothetical protein
LGSPSLGHSGSQLPVLWALSAGALRTGSINLVCLKLFLADNYLHRARQAKPLQVHFVWVS